MFFVDDLNDARNELLDKGVRELEPESEPNGMFLDFVDPEGNVFQITN